MGASQNYLSRHAEQRRIGERHMNAIAERVAEGWSISAAARDIGISQQMASKYWQRIKAGLGDQAA